jgi:hypothetical protein
MALFSIAFDTDADFNIRAVEAGDANEMVSRLAAQVSEAVTAGEAAVIDFRLAGAGSGPQWEAWFVSGSGLGGPNPLTMQEATFVAAVAGNPAEALFYLNQRIAAAAPSTVFKIEVAGAGDGPTYMAVALLLVVIT